MSEENKTVDVVEELKEEALTELSTLEEENNTENERIISDAKEKIKAIFDDLEIWIKNNTEPEKVKEKLKFINDKLLSNSYKSGFENIRNRIENPEIYEKLNQNKLSEKMETAELSSRLEEVKTFLIQPQCRETFVMKGVIYNYINRFWDGKCFLLRANAKKDMREVYEADFSVPLKKFWRAQM